MTSQLIVVENPKKWRIEGINCPVVDADDYLTGEDYFKLKNVQVINLCQSYSYLSVGYYCSLLAEARRHKVVPSVSTMLDLSSKTMYKLATPVLDEAVQKELKKSREAQNFNEVSFNLYFGRCAIPELNELTRQIFETFPCPLLRVEFTRQDKKWLITGIKPISIERLDDDEMPLFQEALISYLSKRWRGGKRQRQQSRYDIAILHNPEDPQPPSNMKALKAFIKAGRNLGMDVELIEKKDFGRLAEYDALFIRDTTRINHYTYRFAKKAESEGMVVIDDPNSILRCTNKVYLAELLNANRIPTPKTVIVGKADIPAAETQVGYPMVVKLPDSSFSQGVFRAENGEQFRSIANKLFKESELILVQEFIYTEFDWRIGILNRKPFYACQYFMTEQHWQIVKYEADGSYDEGLFRTWPIDEVPPEVVKTALKAANLIGDGLYGVDVKQGKDGIYIIEVNDNPNMDFGVEDAALKDGLYHIVMEEFLRRLELRHEKQQSKG